MNISAGHWSNGRRWPGQINTLLLSHVDSLVCLCVCERDLPEEEIAPAWSMGRRLAGEVLQAMFCWKTLGPGIYVDVTTNLNFVVDQVHSFMATVFPNVGGFFQLDNVYSRIKLLIWPPKVQSLEAQPYSITKLLFFVEKSAAHFHGSYGEHGTINQSCFGDTRGTYTIVPRRF